jgi:hypothetical protein
MLEKTITEQELVQNFPQAAQAAGEHALFVTRDDAVSFVLLSIDNYDRILRGDVTIYEAFSRNGLHGEAAECDLAATSPEPEVARAS